MQRAVAQHLAALQPELLESCELLQPCQISHTRNQIVVEEEALQRRWQALRSLWAAIVSAGSR